MVQVCDRAVVAVPDLNLLLALDVLLAEGNVTRAAHRLRLSPSAMSRTLARLRKTMGDPLLVRAGRGLVPTPRALELRDHVGTLVDAVTTVLRPSSTPDLRQVTRTVTIRTSDGFVENFGPRLLARFNVEAPGLRLRFIQKTTRDGLLLREGSVDLETGVVGEGTAPELREQPLFRDRFIGVVRRGHPLGRGTVTLKRYVSAGHVSVSRRPDDTGPIDDALAALGSARRIVASVSGFSAALALARSSNLVAGVPERHTAILRAGMQAFTLPVATPPLTISMLWHPRMQADPLHRWVRSVLRDICAEAPAATRGRGARTAPALTSR